MFELFFIVLREIAYELHYAQVEAMDKAYVAQRHADAEQERRINEYLLSDRMDTFEL